MRCFLRNRKISLLQKAYLASLRTSERRFLEISAAPQIAFEKRLAHYVRANQNTRFGKEHDFRSIKTVEQYRSAVPIRDYEDIYPWIQAALNGEPSVLTSEPILVFEKTGGSASTNKFIPYTHSLRKEFELAMGPWFLSIMQKHPGLIGTTQYWSISPATQKRELSKGGTRIGGTEDTDYFSPIGKWVWQQMLAVPMALSKLEDVEVWRRQTAIHLLRAGDLGLISVWSPTFASNLFSYMEIHWSELLKNVPAKRARAIEQIFTRVGSFDASAIWPRLQLVSCWADGISQQFLAPLKAYLGTVPIQAKGLLATEGLVTLPWGQSSEGHVLSPLSHFIEFLPEGAAHNGTVLPHQLERGGCYSPILTTGGGLYRYHLKDLVRCTGFMDKLPRLSFLGKLDKVSDMVGEKISAVQVESLIGKAKEQLNGEVNFAMMVPSPLHDPHYVLFVETEASDEILFQFSKIIEMGLRESHHYDYARSLGQLSSLRPRRITNGAKTYENTLVAMGQRRGEIKATGLDIRPVWLQAFAHFEA